jgi:hypothetical protein
MIFLTTREFLGRNVSVCLMLESVKRKVTVSSDYDSLARMEPDESASETFFRCEA